VEILKAVRVRLVLNETQDSLAYRTAGSCRFLRNLALEQRSMAYRNSRKSVSFNAQCLDLTQLKKDLPWLAEVPSQVLQQALKDLGQAFQNFFDGFAEHPTSHKKGARDSFRKERARAAKGWVNWVSLCALWLVFL
jgi:putative transposase